MAYVYFNGEKYFPILDLFSSDFLNLSDDKSSYFEVDELMALPVACLNNKGYFTEMSCSGHAIGNLCCELADENIIENLNKESSLITVQYLDEDDAEYMCWNGEPSPGAFIMFKSSFKFQSIPIGWKINSCYTRLSCDVPLSENPMTYYKNISIALETLMEWIMQLPSIS